MWESRIAKYEIPKIVSDGDVNVIWPWQMEIPTDGEKLLSTASTENKLKANETGINN